jgi:PadR family transcriptional regulator, regulatory protein PadR
VARNEVDILQGTLDMLVLKTLSWGSMHGYAILGWLRRVTDGELRIEDAALYPALHRMEARGVIEAEWGLSENNRRAKFYRLSRAGRAQLEAEAAQWSRVARAIDLAIQAG